MFYKCVDVFQEKKPLQYLKLQNKKTKMDICSDYFTVISELFNSAVIILWYFMVSTNEIKTEVPDDIVTL